MRKIHNALYAQKTHFHEANFELLYYTLSKNIRTRSLLVLFTNFETEFAMRRALPVLRQINQKHVLVVVFFNNSELQTIAYQEFTFINQMEPMLVLLLINRPRISNRVRLCNIG